MTVHERAKAIIEEFKATVPQELPTGLPKSRTFDHSINLEPGHTPPLRPILWLSKPELDDLEKQICFLLEHGFIRPSKSPYGAPVLFSKKKDGKLVH